MTTTVSTTMTIASDPAFKRLALSLGQQPEALIQKLVDHQLDDPQFRDICRRSGTDPLGVAKLGAQQEAERIMRAAKESGACQSPPASLVKVCSALGLAVASVHSFARGEEARKARRE